MGTLRDDTVSGSVTNNARVEVAASLMGCFPTITCRIFTMNTGQAVRNILERRKKRNGYMTGEKLLRDLEQVDIRAIQKESLVDIKNVVIDMNMKRKERISDYIRQIKNPYCFVCEGVIVKMNFAQTEDTLEDKLNGYFLSL